MHRRARAEQGEKYINWRTNRLPIRIASIAGFAALLSYISAFVCANIPNPFIHGRDVIWADHGREIVWFGRAGIGQCAFAWLPRSELADKMMRSAFIEFCTAPETRRGEVIEKRSVPSWSMLAHVAETDTWADHGTIWWVEEVGCGLPFTAMHWRRTAPSDTYPWRRMQGAWEVRKGRKSVRSGWRIIVPYQFVWTGMLLNTAVYGLALALLVAGHAWVRRTRRVRRGQCAACGYRLTGLRSRRCPECGVEVPRRLRGAATTASPKSGEERG